MNLRSPFGDESSAKKFLHLAGGMALVAMLALTPARAAITPLTGGDPGEGWTAPVAPVYAYNFLSGGTQTLQGLTFNLLSSTAGNADLAFQPGFWSTSGYMQPSIFSGTANDAALNLMLDGGFTAFQAPPLTSTLTLQNLNPGQLYQVELFVGNNTQHLTTNSVTTYNYSLNGGAYEPAYVGAVSQAYVISLNAVADNSGHITLTELGGAVNNNPGISALDVSAIPEPAIMEMVLLGVLLIALRHRFRKVA